MIILTPCHISPLRMKCKKDAEEKKAEKKRKKAEKKAKAEAEARIAEEIAKQAEKDGGSSKEETSEKTAAKKTAKKLKQAQVSRQRGQGGVGRQRATLVCRDACLLALWGSWRGAEGWCGLARAGFGAGEA